MFFISFIWKSCLHQWKVNTSSFFLSEQQRCMTRPHMQPLAVSECRMKEMMWRSRCCQYVVCRSPGSSLSWSNAQPFLSALQQLHMPHTCVHTLLKSKIRLSFGFESRFFSHFRPERGRCVTTLQMLIHLWPLTQKLQFSAPFEAALSCGVMWEYDSASGWTMPQSVNLHFVYLYFAISCVTSSLV